jgi:hypothetical protein
MSRVKSWFKQAQALCKGLWQREQACEQCQAAAYLTTVDTSAEQAIWAAGCHTVTLTPCPATGQRVRGGQCVCNTG